MMTHHQYFQLCTQKCIRIILLFLKTFTLLKMENVLTVDTMESSKVFGIKQVLQSMEVPQTMRKR